MAKLKKTRKQKLMADQRRIMTESAMYSLPNMKASDKTVEKVSVESVTSTSSATHPFISTSHYTYLTHDLRKTLLVTAVILIIQIILSFVVKI